MNNILVVAASFRGGGSERLAVEFANNALKSDCKVTFFVGVCEGPYLAELNSEVNLVEGNGLRFSKSILQLSRLLKELNVDYIFCSQEYVVSITYFAKLLAGSKACLIGREASTPSVNWAKVSVKGKLLKLLISFVYQRVDKLIVPTESVKADLNNFYRLSRKIDIIPNPVDYQMLKDKSSLAVDFSFNKNCIYLIVVGRLIKSKGVNTIIKSIYLLADSKYNLIVLGDGDLLEELKELANSLGVADQVHFLGFQSNPFPFIKNVDLFISASQYEGMPNSLIQALALNKPCISTLSTSIVASLLPQENIFSYDDATGLAACIRNARKGNKASNESHTSFLTPSSYVKKVLN